MVVTIDLNVILDMFLRRGDYAACLELLTLCKDGAITGIVPSHGLTTTYYVIQKSKNPNEALSAIKYFLEFLKVFPVDAETLREATLAPFSDFEDAVVSIAAKRSGSSYIVTSNTKDFSSSEIPPITPEQFLNRFFN